MPLPFWLRVGHVVETFETFGFVTSLNDFDSSFTVTAFGGSPEPLTIDDVIDHRVTPHRWIERVEPMVAPFLCRVHYRDGHTYETRIGEVPPAFFYDVDDDLIYTPAGRPPSFHRVLRIRPRQDQVYLSGLPPMSRATVGQDFLPCHRPRIEEVVRRVGTFTSALVLDVINPDVTDATRVVVQTEAGQETFSLADFNTNFACNHPVQVPSWVRVGTAVVNLRTGREDTITNYDRVTGRVHMRVGFVTLDALLREWFSDESSNERARNYVDTLWATINPIALLRVTSQQGPIFDLADVEVEIIGSGVRAMLTGSELRARAVEVPENANLGSASPCAGWPVGTMWRLPDNRYVYVLTHEGGTQLVSDSDLIDLEVLLGEAGMNVMYEEFPEVPLTVLTGATSMTLTAPSSLNPYHTRNAERGHAARTNEHTAEAVVDSVEIGQLRAWSSPPALIEVLDQTSVTVTVRIVPSFRVEEVPRSVFDQRTIELTYRARLEKGLDHPVGCLLNGRQGPLAIGATTEGTVIFATHPIESEDLEADVLGGPPETLGYGGRLLQSEGGSTLSQLVERAEAMISTPEPATTEPAVGQVWWIQFGSDTALYRITRLARGDVDAIWVRSVNGGAERPISSGELRRTGTLQDGTSDNAPPDQDEWVEVATHRRCHATQYDAVARAVVIRWAANIEPRNVAIPVSQLLMRFRCLTPGGNDRATALRDAPGQPAWARLRRPAT